MGRPDGGSATSSSSSGHGGHGSRSYACGETQREPEGEPIEESEEASAGGWLRVQVRPGWRPERDPRQGRVARSPSSTRRPRSERGSGADAVGPPVSGWEAGKMESVFSTSL